MARTLAAFIGPTLAHCRLQVGPYDDTTAGQLKGFGQCWSMDQASSTLESHEYAADVAFAGCLLCRRSTSGSVWWPRASTPCSLCQTRWGHDTSYIHLPIDLSLYIYIQPTFGSLTPVSLCAGVG
jgi:hypothetical protein